MDLMCKCQRQEQQVADLRKLIDDIAKLEAPDVSGGGGDNSGNWETQSVCSDVSGVSFISNYFFHYPMFCDVFLSGHERFRYRCLV